MHLTIAIKAVTILMGSLKVAVGKMRNVMSRDFTPYEEWLVEKEQMKQGYPDKWGFMENLKLSLDNGKTQIPYVLSEEIEVRKKYGDLGKFFNRFQLKTIFIQKWHIL